MINLRIKVNTRAFDAAMKDYLAYTKKSLAEVVNTKAYYIARNAVMTTPSVEKEKVEKELRGPSRDYPGVPLAAIIAAKQQKRERYSKKTGKRLKDKAGLSGDRMTAAINKLINIRKNTTNFLRAGWIASIKDIEKYVPKKGGPAYKKVKEKGVKKGGAKGAPKTGSFKTIASIWNSVTGGVKTHNLNKQNNPAKVQAILEIGVQAAVDKEAASMRKYVEDKMAQGAKRFNRT